MPDETKPTVPGEPTPAVVPAEGTPAGGGVAQTTPAQAPVDAEALKREYAEQMSKLEKDIRQVKSTFQSREAQLRREAQQREAELKAQLEQVQVSTMDEETRKIYEGQMAQQRIRELEEQLDGAQSAFETYRATQDAIAHFKRLGVPDDELITDGTFDDLLQSGWDWVSNRMVQMKSAPVAPVVPQPAPLPTAPKVDTGGTTTPPSTKPTWADVKQRYGSLENFFQKFAEGRIPQDQVPD